MAFIIITDSDDPFPFEGNIAGNRKQIIFKSADGSTRIIKTDQIQAIMREDYAERYEQAIAELKRLKFGDPERN